VLAGIGSFGGLFDAAALKDCAEPVLVASTDGVGTKVKLASQLGRYHGLGQDIVNHCVNDILVQGARPLFFLDYFATSRLQPQITAEVVEGIAEACRENGAALLGGETAEMPGVYLEGEFDIAGTIVGVVDRSAILPRKDLRAGDVLVGLRSTGPHTNGFSLLRKIFADTDLRANQAELNGSLADALLAPHRSYFPLLQPVLKAHPQWIKAMAHLTGGGLIENIPRVLPEGLSARIHWDRWSVPPLFLMAQRMGNIDPLEMARVFNMGIGMVVILDPQHAGAFQEALGEECWEIGELVAGEKRVVMA